MPGEDPIANGLRRRCCRRRAAYPIVRWKNVTAAGAHLPARRSRPGCVKKLLRKGVDHARCRPATTSTPTSSRSYNPWDQRLCLVPDGDLFKAISDGSAEIVTDRIETFTEDGIKLESGEELEADVVVTATGLNLLFLGGMKIDVDGEEVDHRGDDRLQGDDAERRPQPAPSRSATPTPPGR